MSPSELEAHLLNGAEPNDFNRTLKRKIRRRDGKQCVICGEEKNLSVAHLIHRDGSDDPRFNDPYNLLLCCRSCHDMIDLRETPHLHILHWDPYDPQNGLRVGLETDDGGIITIARQHLAFYSS